MEEADNVLSLHWHLLKPFFHNVLTEGCSLFPEVHDQLEIQQIFQALYDSIFFYQLHEATLCNKDKQSEFTHSSESQLTYSLILFHLLFACHQLCGYHHLSLLKDNNKKK